MNNKIEFTNGFRALKALNKLADDSRVACIEGYGMDDGRVFIHLATGYKFSGKETHSCSVGSVAEIKEALGLIVVEC